MAGGVAGSQRPLLHGEVQNLIGAAHVACREDVRFRGALLFVGVDVPTVVEVDADLLEPKPIGPRLSSDGKNDFLRADGFRPPLDAKFYGFGGARLPG